MAQKIAKQNDASAESSLFHKPKFCDIQSLRKHAPTVTQNEQIDEESNFINEIRADEIVTERDAPGEHNVQAILRGKFFSISWVRRLPPRRIVVPAQPGSSRVLDTTYLATRLRWSATCVLSSTRCGQNPRISSNVVRPTRKPSDAAACSAVMAASSRPYCVSAVGSNHERVLPTMPSSVMF